MEPEPRTPVASDSRTPPRASLSAGTIPAITPVTTASTTVNASARPLTSIDSHGGSGTGTTDLSRRTSHNESSMPSVAPPTASTMLSVSSCRVRTQLDAPSALRTATSRARPDARASSRFATFAQAMSSTNPTAPRNVYRIAGARPTMTS